MKKMTLLMKCFGLKTVLIYSSVVKKVRKLIDLELKIHCHRYFLQNPEGELNLVV